MPFSREVFRHVTTLQTLVTPPDVSEMRLTLDRFEEFDAQAAAEGWPPGWRLEHDVREANRRSVLGDRLTDDLWVFAYGSLIWDPAVQVDEYRYGTLSGWSRKFCMRLETGRGSREQPGLMAALDEGDGCNGVVFRIQGPLVDRESEFMWRREMFAGAYRPEFLKVETPQGPVEALTFLMDHSNERYMPDISEGEAARMIAAAEGRLGPNFDYLDSLVRHLDELGIADDAMHRLHTRAAGIRASLV